MSVFGVFGNKDISTIAKSNTTVISSPDEVIFPSYRNNGSVGVPIFRKRVLIGSVNSTRTKVKDPYIEFLDWLVVGRSSYGD